MIASDPALPRSMIPRRFAATLLAAALGCGAALPGCGAPAVDELSPSSAAGGPPEGAPPADSVEVAARRRARPPPAQCDRRHRGVTAIQAVVRIERYRGLVRGRNGTHEIAEGVIVDTPWVFDASAVDARKVELAMNVASGTDPTGLPREVRLSPGEVVEVEGEYIPAAQAHAREGRAQVAVIHFTHAPCGYVEVAGRLYR